MPQFFTKHHALRLIRRNGIRKPSEFGIIDAEPEMVVEFEPGGGSFTVNEDGTWFPEAGYRGEWILPDGPNGTPQTLLEWLRTNRNNGVLFHEEEVPVPEPSLELRELSKLAAGQDVAGIEELAAREERTFNRPEVFEAIKEALEAIHKVAPKKVAHLIPEAVEG